jgi:hypothetical protein
MAERPTQLGLRSSGGSVRPTGSALYAADSSCRAGQPAQEPAGVQRAMPRAVAKLRLPADCGPQLHYDGPARMGPASPARHVPGPASRSSGPAAAPSPPGPAQAAAALPPGAPVPAPCRRTRGPPTAKSTLSAGEGREEAASSESPARRAAQEHCGCAGATDREPSRHWRGSQ